MDFLSMMLLAFILICALIVCLTRNLLTSIIILMSQSLAMSVVWILLRSPDLAITEAAVGAGVSSILMFAALKRINAVTKRTFPEAVAGYDPDLIHKALRRKNVRDDILLHGRCPEIVTLVKNM